MTLYSLNEDWKNALAGASQGTFKRWVNLHLATLPKADPDWTEICDFETAREDPQKFAKFCRPIFCSKKVFPAFLFVAEKNPGDDIPTEGFFYPAGYVGACPAIRVKRVAVEHKNKADTFSLSTEAGILRVGKTPPTGIYWKIGHSRQLRWPRDVIVKALDMFGGEGNPAEDFVNFASFATDHEEKVRFCILLHYYDWLDQVTPHDTCAAELRQYGLGIQNPKIQKKSEADIVTFERSHIKNFIDRMKIEGLTDLTKAAEVHAQTERAKQSGTQKLQKKDVKYPDPAKRSEPKPSVKQSNPKKYPVKSSKTKKRSKPPAAKK